MKSLEFHLPKFAASLRHGMTRVQELLNTHLSTWPAVSELICSNLLLSNVFPYKKLENHFTSICHCQGSRIQVVNVQNARKKGCFKIHGNLAYFAKGYNHWCAEEPPRIKPQIQARSSPNEKWLKERKDNFKIIDLLGQRTSCRGGVQRTSCTSQSSQQHKKHSALHELEFLWVPFQLEV